MQLFHNKEIFKQMKYEAIICDKQFFHKHKSYMML